MLKGFSGDDHTIEFGGSVGSYSLNGSNVPGYTIDVIDHVHVV